jgi:FSR family fosmidomycin resistance protein-like MFS transporter
MNSTPIRAIFLIALGHLTIELCINYLPVVYPILMQTLALSYTQVGTITLVSVTATSLVQPLFGYLSEP